MAERYNCLPTEILRNASTVDLIIFDTALSWRNYQHTKQKGSIPKDSVSVEDLQERMNRAKRL